MSDRTSLILKPRADLTRINFGAFQATATEAASELAAVTSAYRHFHSSAKNLEELYAQKAFWDVLERLCLYKAVLSPHDAQDQLSPFVIEGLFGDPASLGRLLSLIDSRGGSVPQLTSTLVFFARLGNLQGAILLAESATDQDHASVMARSIRHSLRIVVNEPAAVDLPWISYLKLVEGLCYFNEGRFDVAHQCIESARDRLNANIRFRHIASTVKRRLAANLIVSLGSRDTIENLLSQSLADKESFDARLELSNYYWAIDDGAASRRNAVEALATARTAYQRAIWEVNIADEEDDPQRRVELLEEIRSRWSADGDWITMGEGALVDALIRAYNGIGECKRLGSWILLIEDSKSNRMFKIQFAKGNYFSMSGQLEQSIEYFQKALELTNNVACKVDTSLRLAYVFDSLGRFEDALSTARDILAVYPGFGPAEELVRRMRLRTTGRRTRRK